MILGFCKPLTHPCRIWLYCSSWWPITDINIESAVVMVFEYCCFYWELYQTYYNMTYSYASETVLHFALHPEPLLIIWINFNPSMSNEVRDEITYPFPNFNDCTVEVWQWIRNFIPQSILGVITYPWWYKCKRGPVKLCRVFTDILTTNFKMKPVSFCFKYSHIQKHGDVFKWKHSPRYWPFVRGIHRSPVNSPHKGQWRGALMFSLICVWINGWVNNGEAGDLTRHRTHYDVTVTRSRGISGVEHGFSESIFKKLMKFERNVCKYI